MTKSYCDRCGQECEQALGALHPLKLVRSSDSGIRLPLDLCGDCRDELRAWLEARKPK